MHGICLALGRAIAVEQGQGQRWLIRPVLQVILWVAQTSLVPITHLSDKRRWAKVCSLNSHVWHSSRQLAFWAALHHLQGLFLDCLTVLQTEYAPRGAYYSCFRHHCQSKLEHLYARTCERWGI